jgi:hypothetical protein
MSRGVLYLAWPGDPRTQRMLARSIASLNKFHPELEHKVVWLSEGSNLLDKAGMGHLTLFDETLFLDADTVVMGRLDHGFEKAKQHGLACCICECPWARRYPSLSGDAIEYNTGVLFWTAKAKPVFDLWNDLSGRIDSSILFHADDKIAQMPRNDQASFAMAVEQTGFNPFVLPLNYNFRPLWHKSWFGPLKVWHDYTDPPAGVVDFSEAQSAADAIIRYAERE